MLTSRPFSSSFIVEQHRLTPTDALIEELRSEGQSRIADKVEALQMEVNFLWRENTKWAELCNEYAKDAGVWDD